ncbi:hypothetical protein SDC9_08042 [bioreactor metagenome]|uniref:Uncharacterized protein n=1 Tax=bioreactor metagenome TaxID=1076179 RepID=A0A644T8B1_9ZZZZ|nr:hypothetical protein [Candidatus Elulimicrobiales bacterium]
MVSLEQLKKESAEKQQKKQEEEKKLSKEKSEKKALEYQDQVETVERLGKRKEKVEKSLKESEKKKIESKSAFKWALEELKSQYEDVKNNPDSIFAHFFKKDESGQVLEKVDFKKVRDEKDGIDEIKDSLIDLKKSAKKTVKAKRILKNIENTEKVAKDKKEELFKNTDEYLATEHLREGDRYFNIDNLKKYSYLDFPFKKAEELIKKESEENIERLRDIYKDKVLKRFEENKEYKELGVESAEYKKIEDVVKSYAENSFNERIELYKLRREKGDDRFDETSGKYELDNFQKEMYEIGDQVYYLGNIQKRMNSGPLKEDQKISFEKSNYELPLLQKDIGEIEEFEEQKTKLKLKLKAEEELLKELEKKNPLFGKSAHKEKLDNLKRAINTLKLNFKDMETSLKDKKNNPLGKDNDKHVFETIDKIVYSDLHKIFENEERRNRKTLAEVLRNDFLKREQNKENITLGEYIEAIAKIVKEKESFYKWKEKEIIEPLKKSLKKYLDLKEKTEESRKEFLKLTKN